ncbi:MAG: hypothetical protein DMG74_20115 [Acidobacteria bacterium]|nr:MAG: hypothetical protein DMG74_20115 [Acidobacteriota bacterium]
MSVALYAVVRRWFFKLGCKVMKPIQLMIRMMAPLCFSVHQVPPCGGDRGSVRTPEEECARRPVA